QGARGGQGSRVPPPNQRLAPRGEQHADRVCGPAADPADEPREARPVVGQLVGRLGPLGERAVAAGVVATGERPAVKDREVHFAWYPAMRFRTRSEKNHGPRASDRSSPSAVGTRRPASHTTRPRSANVWRSGKSSAGSVPNRAA